ncbi:MAG: ABC transporter [Campylobacteraceae bacterium 4484_4]|nr:MAG: ABC transporter [Campylobacteraceae bacterium 4484_4]
MYSVDISLIKMVTDHYWIKRDRIVNKISFKGRTFFDKYERIDQPLTRSVMNRHDAGEIIVAHSLINARDKVENIVFDYNGRNTEKFWHRAQLMLREEGYLNFTAYESKTPGHLHLYVHKGHTTLQEGYQIAKMLSMKLATRLPREWKMFPNPDIPREFNILNLPKKVYQKERGASWAKHM